MDVFSPYPVEHWFVGITAQGEAQSVVAQVVDVSRGLLGVRTCTKSGNTVVFDSGGTHTETRTGQDHLVGGRRKLVHTENVGQEAKMLTAWMTGNMEW